MKANSETVNILFAGTGGQGVLKAAEVCGWAALYEGFSIKKSEVHGMAQRGGSVESHVRFGKNVYSPLIPKGSVDFLVSFHKGERDRLKDFLKPAGRDLIDALDEAQKNVKDNRYINTYLLGVLSCYLPIAENNWLKALEFVFAGKNIEQNQEIFHLARKGRL